jgi:hypothetical protein
MQLFQPLSPLEIGPATSCVRETTEDRREHPAGSKRG